jgi:O-antigen ligase
VELNSHQVFIGVASRVGLLLLFAIVFTSIWTLATIAACLAARIKIENITSTANLVFTFHMRLLSSAHNRPDCLKSGRRKQAEFRGPPTS